MAFILRLLIIILSSYIPLIGMDSDAVGFFEKSNNFKWVNFDLLETDSNIFVIWNYFLFKIFGNFMFVGQLFCLFAWLFSYYILYLILIKLNISKKYFLSVFLIYCFLPSSLLITSSFLRESYQLLFVNLSVYFFLNMQSSRRFFSNLFFLLICFIVLFLLHVSFIIVPLGFLIIYIYNKSFRFLKKIKLYPFLFVILIFLFYLIPNFEIVKSLIELDLISAESSADSRAFYVDFDVPFNPIFRLVQYFFEPFPWRGLSIVDGVSITENLIRLFFIVKIFQSIFNKKTAYLPSFFILFLIMEYLWAVFTYNWGTAIRHHLPQFGLLLIAYLQTALISDNAIKK